MFLILVVVNHCCHKKCRTHILGLWRQWHKLLHELRRYKSLFEYIPRLYVQYFTGAINDHRWLFTHTHFVEKVHDDNIYNSFWTNLIVIKYIKTIFSYHCDKERDQSIGCFRWKTLCTDVCKFSNIWTCATIREENVMSNLQCGKIKKSLSENLEQQEIEIVHYNVDNCF